MSIVRLSRGATCSNILGQHQQTKAVLFTGVELCLDTFNVLLSPVELYRTFDNRYPYYLLTQSSLTTIHVVLLVQCPAILRAREAMSFYWLSE